MLNPGYTWDDGSTKAKAKQCVIQPKQVPKPSCNNITYDGGTHNIVTVVDEEGKYVVYTENAISLDDSPMKKNAGDYKFIASLNSNNNYTWEHDVSSNIFHPSYFENATLNCKINPIVIDTSQFSCANLTYNGEFQVLLNGFAQDFDGYAYWAIDGNYPYVFPVASTTILLDADVDYYSVTQDYIQGSNDPNTFFMEGDDGGEVMYEIDPIAAGNAGTYPVHFKANTNYIFSNNSREYTLNCTIKQKNITIGTTNQSKKYDGTPLKANDDCEVISGSFAGRREVKLECKNSGSITSVGSIPKEITPTLTEIDSDIEKSLDSTSNYNITIKNGTLTVNKCNIVITAASDKKNYDGTELTNSDFMIDVDSLMDVYIMPPLKVTGSQTDVGKSDNVLEENDSKIKVPYIEGALGDGGTPLQANRYIAANTNCNIKYENGVLEVYDNTKPTCSLSVNDEGVISATMDDKHGLNYFYMSHSGNDSSGYDNGQYTCAPNYYKKSGSTTYKITSPSTYTMTVGDCSGNTSTCSITVKKQQNTRSCADGNRCSSASCQTRYYCCSSGTYASIDGKATCCTNTSDSSTCDSSKWGQHSSCNCQTRNKDIEKCGCASWNNLSTTWTDNNQCSSGVSSDNKTETRCRYAKG